MLMRDKERPNGELVAAPVTKPTDQKVIYRLDLATYHCPTGTVLRSTAADKNDFAQDRTGDLSRVRRMS